MYLLIVVAFITGSAGGPSTVSMHEFKTLEQCEIAKKKALELIRIDRWAARAECSALGEGKE